jgi:predicted esterase
MGKNLFYFGIALGILNAGLLSFQVLLHIRIGEQFYSLPSFLLWLHFTSVVYLAWLLFILTYHYYATHTIALVTGSLLFVAVMLRYYVIYRTFTYSEWRDFYFPSYFLVLIATSLYAASLTFTYAIKGRWLKIAGILSGVTTVILLITFVGYLDSKNLALKSSYENWHNTTSQLSGLIIICFLIHFWLELKKKQTDPQTTGIQKTLSMVLFLGTVIILIYAFMLGNRLVNEKPVARYPESRATSQDKAIASRFEARIFISQQKDTLLYRLLKPINYDPSLKYPLVLCLHGGAGWGTDNIKQVQGALPAVMLSNYLVREQHPAFLFVPQISPAYSWGGLPKFKVVDSLVFEAIRSLEKEFSTDENRRYISGNSLGGYGTWYFIATHPNFFAAAIPISGEGDATLAKNMVNIPIWAFHGTKDINVPVNGSRDVIEAIRKQGGNPRYTEYPDKDHDIWKDVVNTPHLVDWLFEQRRNIGHTPNTRQSEAKQ